VNQSEKCEGPGGGDRWDALCTGFTLVQMILKSWSGQNGVCPNTSVHWTQRITVVRVHFKELEMAGRDVPNASDHWSQWITLVPIISKIDTGHDGLPEASDHRTQRIKVVWIISKSGKGQHGRPLDAEAVRLLETVNALRRRRRRRCRRFCHPAPSSSSLGYVRRGAPSSSYSRRPLISIDQCCTRLLVLMNDSNVR
jgi:hypothetical protein